MDDLESRVFGELPDETWFYPGHGEDSTLGKERPKAPGQMRRKIAQSSVPSTKRIAPASLPYSRSCIALISWSSYWSQLPTMVQRRRTERLVGAPTNGEEQPELRFTVVHQSLPASGITVTLDDACDLADVYDLCTQIAAARLDDDHYISLTRATPDPDAGALRCQQADSVVVVDRFK